jgi:glycosyltransferase involved in cell wall biosynthesis
MDNSLLTFDSSLIFNPNPGVFGGTEYMVNNFNKYIAKDMINIRNYESLVIPGLFFKTAEMSLFDNKKVILWIHNLPNQFDMKTMHVLTDQRFLDRVEFIVLLSEYHKAEFLKMVPINENKIVIIPNAIDPINNNIKRFNNVKKVKIIHTSHSERGMAILLKSLSYIDIDFELSIYNNFFPDTLNASDELFKVLSDSRIKFFGTTPKQTVLKDLAESHIFAYPSIYKETFCISQVEALSANCLCVYNEYGALPEVSFGFGQSYSGPENIEDHAKIFAKQLNKAILEVKSNRFSPAGQAEKVNDEFSWKNIKTKWVEFDNKLIGEKNVN